jgi:hypothetical protein
MRNFVYMSKIRGTRVGISQSIFLDACTHVARVNALLTQIHRTCAGRPEHEKNAV